MGHNTRAIPPKIGLRRATNSLLSLRCGPKFGHLAVAQAKYYWHYLQEFEQSQVPTEKSYFALLNAGRLHEPLQDDAELFGLEELQITGGVHAPRSSKDTRSLTSVSQNIPENDDREMDLQAREDERRKVIPTSTVNEGSPLSPRSHSKGSEERVTETRSETIPVKKPPVQRVTEKNPTRRSNN